MALCALWARACGSARAADAMRVSEGASRARESGDAATADHSGLAARRLLVAGAASLVAAGIALSEGTSWFVAALCATDISPRSCL